MARIINQVAVFGLGKVGELVALLLADAGFKVVGLDAAPRPVLTADGVELEVRPLDVADDASLRESLRGVDAVVSCLPYHLNVTVAEAAHDAGVHYFDLTEDVATTQRVLELSRTRPPAGRAQSTFAPQCGLAPGLIGIVGASLAEGFDEIRSIELKVGALPQNPTGLLGYAFNWSAEGVVNEYLNDCEVLRSGHRQMVPAMTEKERVFIGGIELEAALTSGGLGTMCETYEGRVNRLDYKTLRYPGHFRQMHFLFDELNLRDQRELIGGLLVDAKPPVNDDIVYLHAAVEGVKAAAPFRENYVRGYLPIEIGGRIWRAISWTTAASAVAVVELVADGRLAGSGFVKQEDIALSDLLDTRAGRLFDDHSTITQSERALT
ncbi:saccharopine dehydrogenase family protein [Aeromicrobium sp.]|uniref:saccharopine dehydrogenase family protein n=1 Tax=Aeromicrobium sp. TaxID=1871063 RepID=UPI003C3E236B